MLKKRRFKKGINLSKNEFIILTDLFLSISWLSNHKEAIYELMDICRNFNEQLFICDLFYGFEHLDMDKTKTLLVKMADQIINEWKLIENETQIVSTSVDFDPDSAQQILQMLRPEFVKKSWLQPKLINQIGKSIKNIKRFPYVVYVDEFVGTGKTMVKRINNFRAEYDAYIKDKNYSVDYEIKVCVLASIIDAKQVVEETGVEMFSAIWLKKGLSGHFLGRDLELAKKRMLRLESELKPKIGKKELPSLGFGGAEALYCMEGGNTPNSVFPVYWWPFLKNEYFRNTVLTRQENYDR